MCTSKEEAPHPDPTGAHEDETSRTSLLPFSMGAPSLEVARDTLEANLPLHTGPGPSPDNFLGHVGNLWESDSQLVRALWACSQLGAGEGAS